VGEDSGKHGNDHHALTHIGFDKRIVPRPVLPIRVSHVLEGLTAAFVFGHRGTATDFTLPV
jgi:hypothetical protein